MTFSWPSMINIFCKGIRFSERGKSGCEDELKVVCHLAPFCRQLFSLEVIYLYKTRQKRASLICLIFFLWFDYFKLGLLFSYPVYLVFNLCFYFAYLLKFLWRSLPVGSLDVAPPLQSPLHSFWNKVIWLLESFPYKLYIWVRIK